MLFDELLYSIKFIIDEKDQADVTNMVLELAVYTEADVETYSWSLVLDWGKCIKE